MAVGYHGPMSEYDAEGRAGAPAIVFVHGTRVTRSIWSGQLGAFSDRYRTVAVDLPGHGELADVPFGLSAFIARLDAIVRREAADGRAVLVGHSLGGYVAIEYAARFPERTAALVVCNASLEPRRLLTIPHRSLAYVADLAGQRLRERVSDRVRSRAYRTVTAGAPIPDPGGLLFKGSRNAVRDVIGQQFLPKLRAYPGPVLLVNGTDDPLFRRDEAAFLTATHDGTLRVIEGAGHVPFVERPAAFDEALRRFLDSIHW
jgi:pimeloyl-ACP methyl ester carboxylesterase